MVVPLWLYVPEPSFAFAPSSIKSPASNLMLLAMLILTLPSICAEITALLAEPLGEVNTCTVGCVKYPEPGLVIVTLVTTPLTTFSVATA